MSDPSYPTNPSGVRTFGRRRGDETRKIREHHPLPSPYRTLCLKVDLSLESNR